jgi:hypothetical protein
MRKRCGSDAGVPGRSDVRENGTPHTQCSLEAGLKIGLRDFGNMEMMTSDITRVPEVPLSGRATLPRSPSLQAARCSLPKVQISFQIKLKNYKYINS